MLQIITQKVNSILENAFCKGFFMAQTFIKNELKILKTKNKY